MKCKEFIWVNAYYIFIYFDKLFNIFKKCISEQHMKPITLLITANEQYGPIDLYQRIDRPPYIQIKYSHQSLITYIQHKFVLFMNNKYSKANIV